ncbi:helix-hairpin-helix domain-containing protein [Variovorax terrae]|uniref:Helix-hairpin-helix domain-containing protein n=1 Tax=Variovorax terrae TaxID=2923278 RepID=A0A9X2AM70_9BURK|nr:helix-hairpin-helix domain-containing protein [Variovorax terrae]MCJ0763398.1 helix-hairpin-helix domain-containing protein [Variovorax terrae]
MKAATAQQAQALEDIPNIGRAIASDLRLIGIHQPQQLQGRDALALYRSLNRATHQRQDPCVLDTFMAAVDFMNGAAPAPWWHYTAQRKSLYRDL